jgi:hypothetical protein
MVSSLDASFLDIDPAKTFAIYETNSAKGSKKAKPLLAATACGILAEMLSMD